MAPIGALLYSSLRVLHGLGSCAFDNAGGDVVGENIRDRVSSVSTLQRDAEALVQEELLIFRKRTKLLREGGTVKQ